MADPTADPTETNTYRWPDGTFHDTPHPAYGRDAPPPQTGPSGPPIGDQINQMFQGTSYGGSPELQNILSKYQQTQDPNRYPGGPGQWVKDIKTTMDQYANTFTSMFTNQVGRPPTQDEYNTFFQQVVTPDSPWTRVEDQAAIGQQTQGLLSNVYSGTAQQEAAKKLQDQATAALAPGSAFDIWQQAYGTNVNNTTKVLQDYQSKLFEKIRPQLLTSLQSQGLLNTGGLNEAMAGVQGDLANTGSMYAAQLQGQAAQDIANQRYAIQSNPSNYQMAATSGNPSMMLGQGQNALQNVWNNYMQNQQFGQQQNLLNQQYANQPSLLQQYGGMMLGGMAGGAGQRLAMWGK